MIRLVDACLRRPRRVLAAALLLLVLAVVGLTQLGTTAAVRTVVGTGSDAYRADRDVARAFGDEAIVVLVRQSARDTVLTDDVTRVGALEGCLGGKAPESAGTLPGGEDGPCEELRDLTPARVVYGPGTFVNTGVGAVNEQVQALAGQAATAGQTAQARAEAAARRRGDSASEIAAAGRRAAAKATRDLQARIAGYAQLAQEFDINPTGVSATDTRFVQRLVFGGTGTTPRAQFRAVLPTADAGLIAVRLRADLSDADRRRAVDLVQRAVALPDFRLTHGGSYVVSGSPVLVDAVAGELERALLALLGVGVLVMALVLAATFPERRRLGPLLLALGTVAVVFGGMGLLGLPADLGTIATLPVLLGLAVDYGVQLHARVEESRRAGLAGPEAVRDAVARGGRPIVLAAGATLVGFVALLASPTPLVRGFALVLGAGVALAVLAAFTVGLVLHARRAPRPAAVAATPEAEATTAPRRADPVAPAALPAGGLGTGPVVRRLVAGAYGRPRAVLAVGTVLALAGLVLGAREPVETSIERLVPGDLPAVRDLGVVERESGQAGELQVLVRGRDLARPEVLAWADGLRSRVLRGAGYDPAKASGCGGAARLCPLSVPFSALLGQEPAKLRDGAAVREALAGLPAYFTSAAITEDRRSILLSFGVPVGPLDRQRDTIDAVRRAATVGRPAGVSATVTGLPTLAADASASISSPARRILTLLATLVLVAGLLLAVTRSARRGLLPVLPVALAAGWSGLLTWALGLPLNPLSVVLGTLIVAIGTEFGVLLLERYGQERAAGHPDAVALARTAASTGRAVGASAATTVAGFGVLAVSDFPLLRQFGLITVLDLLVAVLGVVVVLPAVAGLAAGRRRRGAAPTPPAPVPGPAREEVPA